MNFLSKISVPIVLSGLSIIALTAFGLNTVYTNATVLSVFFGGFIYRELVGFVKYRGKEKIYGKTVIVTGANTGIGFETAKNLAARGGRIILASRDAKKNEAARRRIIDATRNQNIVTKPLDLASLQSIRDFCDDFIATESRLDILVANAGIMMCPKMLTQDGMEMQLGVNHMGHFLLVNLLLDKLKACAPSRIVIVSSVGHKFTKKINFEDLNSEKSYSRFQAYFQSKLANVLHAAELSKRLKGTGVTANSLHPGGVNTELSRHFGILYTNISFVLLAPVLYYLSRTPYEGAQTSIRCAVDPSLEAVSGKYFANCKIAECSEAGLDEIAARRLWEISEEWTSPRKAK